MSLGLGQLGVGLCVREFGFGKVQNTETNLGFRRQRRLKLDHCTAASVFLPESHHTRHNNHHAQDDKAGLGDHIYQPFYISSNTIRQNLPNSEAGSQN
jgi:hypothetical protein